MSYASDSNAAERDVSLNSGINDVIWQGARVIDRSIEVSSIRENTPANLTWDGESLSPEQWCVEITPEAQTEIDLVAQQIINHPVQLFQRQQSELAWENARICMQTMKSRLLDGPGFAVLTGLDPDRYSADTNLELYWLLGSCLARPVAQKWNGEMIYSVKDTGEKYGYGVRGSRTTIELVFHVDNAFGRAVPDYVGLYCAQPAKQGGISRFCSLYTVHERLRRSHEKALERLYQPMLFDRQKEHAPDAAPVLLAPFFSWRGDRLFARANTSLVRKGYQVAELEMDSALQQALSAIDEVCADPKLWVEAPLQRGHLQYLNNHEIGHYRSEFVDYPDPALKRHLYRLWHRESGTVEYDGGVDA